MMLIGFLALTLLVLLIMAGLKFNRSLQEKNSSVDAQLHAVIFLQHD